MNTIKNILLCATFISSISPILAVDAEQKNELSQNAQEAFSILVDTPIELEEYLNSLNPSEKEELKKELQAIISNNASGFYESARIIERATSNESFLLNRFFELTSAYAAMGFATIMIKDQQLAWLMWKLSLLPLAGALGVLALGAYSDDSKCRLNEYRSIAKKEDLIQPSAKLLQLI